MRLLKWIPWRYFATRTARAYGFLDPIQFLSRLRQFSKPSEVSEPIELLRAGVLFHARGLVNTKAIQNNLDWVWPYWVERQFNPSDPSFIPRAFSFSHINLTHRNWTAVGLPDVPYYPIVDPRGLVTPLFDGWSLDFWLTGPDKRVFLPSKLETAEQSLEVGGKMVVRTRVAEGDWAIETTVEMQMRDHRPHCVISVRPQAPPEVKLAVVVRPYNPEGISFIESISIREDFAQWEINGKDRLIFSKVPHRTVLANYKEGDVLHALFQPSSERKVECDVSMASGAALFDASEAAASPLQITVPIIDELKQASAPSYEFVPTWRDEIAKCSRLRAPDARIQRLYEQAVAVLCLHAPLEIYPGPYTYKRFWFRDAAFMLNALLSLGSVQRSRKVLDQFAARQTRAGYFLSQAGEWDSNGEAIWILHRYLRLTGTALPPEWRDPIRKGAEWIIGKRLPRDLKESHAGLLPAGFSAEHLGPNDYYYWDNFWGVAGLRCAAELIRETHPDEADRFFSVAEEYLQTIIASFRHIPDRQARGAISASPHRRLDAGAVGSIVADFPLQLFPPGEGRIVKTTEYLLGHSFFGGGFFQNMIHSGINAYLTLHIAQTLLRAGDLKALELIDAVAGLASPTGQWPEAIHPQTGGGCMGDGQHVWAAAEWAMMIRNLFVREEGGRLVIGSGIFPRWLERGEKLEFENTLTPHGPVSVALEPAAERRYLLRVTGQWRQAAPLVEVRVPGYIAGKANEAGTFLLEPNL